MEGEEEEEEDMLDESMTPSSFLGSSDPLLEADSSSSSSSSSNDDHLEQQNVPQALHTPAKYQQTCSEIPIQANSQTDRHMQVVSLSVNKLFVLPSEQQTSEAMHASTFAPSLNGTSYLLKYCF